VVLRTDRADQVGTTRICNCRFDIVIGR